MPFTTTAQVASGTSAYAIVARQPAAPLWMTQNLNGFVNFEYTPVGLAFPQFQGSSLDIASTISDVDDWKITAMAGTLQPLLAVDCETNEPWYWLPPGGSGYLAIELNAEITTQGTYWLDVEFTRDFTTEHTTTKRLDVVTPSGLHPDFFSEFGDPTRMYWCWANFYGFWRPKALTCSLDSGMTTPELHAIHIGYSSETMSTGFADILAPLIQPPEIQTAPMIYNSMRANAVGVCFSNTTAVLSKEGSVEAFYYSQSSKDKGWSGLQNLNYFPTLFADTAPKNRYSGLLEKGLYTFTLPDEPSMQFHDRVVQIPIIASTGNVPLIQLGASDIVNIIRFTDYGEPGTTLLVSGCIHSEFRSSSMLWPVAFSRMPLEEWHRAVLGLTDIGPFFENPVHLAAIAALARAAAIRALPYLAPVASAALSAAKEKILGMAQAAAIKYLGPPPPPQKQKKKTTRRLRK